MVRPMKTYVNGEGEVTALTAQIERLEEVLVYLRAQRRHLVAEVSRDRNINHNQDKLADSQHIMDLFREGKSWREIGQLCGLSPDQAKRRWYNLEYYQRKCATAKEPLNPEDSVNRLTLSVRAANVLNNANIETIGQLTAKSLQEMYKYRCCGRCTVYEIKYELASHGIEVW